MGVGDYRSDDQIGSGLSTGTTMKQMAQARQDWEIQRQEAARGNMIGFTVFAAIAVLLLLSVVLHRRKIARSADAALVSGLATGVRAVRAATAKKDALVERVLAKADAEKPPKT